jgi:hypothetical protein
VRFYSPLSLSLSLPLPHITDASMHSEVYGVPKELREILESCLGEDPSPQVLKTDMPAAFSARPSSVGKVEFS